MQKILLVISLLMLIPVFGFSQKNNSVVSSVPDVAAINLYDKKITLPSTPIGYHLILKGSDHTPIIDNTGKIYRPLITTNVKLYFQLINNDIDSIKYDVSKEVIVPGRYADSLGNPKPFVIPSLREWHGGKGKFNLTPAARIVIESADKKTIQKAAIILQKELNEQTGFKLSIISGTPHKGDVFLTLHEHDSSISNEGYYLIIKNYIKISAIKYQGLFWGTRTLLQLLEHKKAIPQGIARDYPEFKVRGFVLDDGRKFFKLQFLRDYVKVMAYYKMNDFQIHLSDNGSKKYFNDKWDSTYSAFRLESRTYPNLTAKDGSYTKKEFIALQQLANDYAVHIIPEIDVPAHSLAFTKAVPAIASKLYGNDHLDLHNPLTYTVIENVFKEYLSGKHPVFTGKEVHIGTDEYAKPDAEAFRTFTDHFIKYVQGFGKDVRLWGALTHAQGTTPVTVKNVTMNTWYNGYANPVDMKKLGYNQISTPDGWLYIVPAAGYYYDYLNIKNIYNKWTPYMIGNIQFTPGDPTILGGSFAEWNDIVGNGISEKDVHDRVFPAMQVLAEKMWNSSNALISFDDFATQSKTIGEGTSVNIRGKIGDDQQPLVGNFSLDKKSKAIHLYNVAYVNGYKGKALSFHGKNSFAILPYQEIGYDYTVSFWINPSADNDDDATIFSSVNSVVKLKQKNTGRLGFSRDGYNFDFNYTLPPDTWTHIVITGTNKGTCLYVNGKLQTRLYDNYNVYNDKDKTKKRKVETLFFPLHKIGGFKGKLDEVNIWNTVLPDDQICNLK